ncbi:MAG: PEGA domain-containing protein [Archangium sp.]
MSERRKATVPELAAAIFLLFAGGVLTGSVLMHRWATRSTKPNVADVPELNGAMITPTVAQEGLTYTAGPELLFVDTTPASAQVLLDGQALGDTPYSSNLSCRGGAAKLEVKKAGYQSVSFDLSCGKGTARVSVSLKRGKP